MGRIKIICAFPLCGKTWAFRHQGELPFGRIADSDSSVYHWIKDRNEEGIERMTLNPSFPKNYIDNALELIDDGYDVVFLSTHEKVLMELNAREIDYYICFPCKEMRLEWLRRAYRRSYNAFDPDVLFNRPNFDYMVDSMYRLTGAHPDRRYVIASSGLYMPDVLTFYGFEKRKGELRNETS